MIHLGDITKLRGWEVPIVDVITGGSPCQDLSVAGKRAGLEGERSALFMEQIRLVKEMREHDRNNGRTGMYVRPRYCIWENVPGAFSSNGGKDFQAVLTEFARVCDPEAPDVPLPDKGKWPKSGCLYDELGRWSIAWRVHDAQFWGVPQRRKRIALVADFGGLSAPEILFERKGLCWHPEPGGEERQGSAGAVGGRGMSELATKEAKSIERLKAFEPPEGYYLAFSGGKDSVVCKALIEIAGVKYDAHYRVTSVDPPELVRFIRDKHPDVEREVPRDDNGKPITMWNLIPRKLMPPTRLVRYCCSELKEDGGDGRMTVTGVRWAESSNRQNNHGPVTMMGKSSAKAIGDSPDFQQVKKGGVILINDNTESRRMIESCYKRHRTTVNPIIEWTDDDVWAFIRAHGIPYCELYDCGFKRLGCVGCSMAPRKTRLKEFAIWPKFYDAYMNAFGKMLEARRARGRLDSTWRMGQTPQDVMNWWLESGVLPGQYDLFEMEGEG